MGTHLVRLLHLVAVRAFAGGGLDQKVVRPARVIWNQAIGALFLVLATPALINAVQTFRTLDSDPKSTVRLAVALIFGMLMVFFGINSFLKARRIASQVRRA